jgi:hypothetical protein
MVLDRAIEKRSRARISEETAMRNPVTSLLICLAGLVLATPGILAQQPRPAPILAPTYTISLGGRNACVTPCTRNRARADGGIIDVQSPAANTITVAMTGAPAADSYLGCTSSATQTFHLIQEFEIACSDPSVQTVVLTLDSSLVGYVRSMRKAGACVRLASAAVTPESWEGTPVGLTHPPLCVSGTDGRLCNQHLPPVQGPPMPLGRYTLVADFVLDTTASGVCNAHAAADFSPDTALPAGWVRMRDPFQGVSKKSFGFALTLSAAAAPASLSTAATPLHPSALRRAALVPAASPPRRNDIENAKRANARPLR